MHELTTHKPLRLWPGIVAALAFVVVRFVMPAVAPSDGTLFGMPIGIAAILGGVVAAVLILLWWILFSRARWFERLGAVAVMAIAIFATRFILDESIAGAAMGMLFPFFSLQTMSVALVAWAVATKQLSAKTRRLSMIVTILLACGAWALVRTGGITGEGVSDLHWRWTPTPEQRLLAQSREVVAAPAPTAASVEKPVKPAATPSSPPEAAKTADTTATTADDPKPSEPKAEIKSTATSDPGFKRAEWPGFRGPNRDNVVSGVSINTDWSASPPVEVWRRPIGPGWSSFAVDGDRIYTQEQRGENEVVSCYRLSTGQPVWTHRDPTRFYESNGGPGPRGTPTLHNGRVYALGATGILNALDATNGAVIWSRNAAADTEVTVPDWGVSSSPLVIDDMVVVAVSGRLAAYDLQTGQPRWLGPTGGAGYSSPHLVTIDGVPQIVLLRGSRTISVAPADGTLLWEHRWVPGVGIVQPAQMPDGDVLITVSEAAGIGIRRVAVAKDSSGWRVEERWTSRGLKPYFNDFVVHEGHAYGFDGSILSCIDLADGTRKWKGGRYGHGQLMAIAEQDLLLVLSEEGELVLVKASPDQFTEVAKFPAIEGKTWNHPVLVGDTVLVRNGEEMAAFRLPAVSTH